MQTRLHDATLGGWVGVELLSGSDRPPLQVAAAVGTRESQA